MQSRGLIDGHCLWLTGLSGAGKTTISVRLAAQLGDRGFEVTRLDGDILRQTISRGLGFSREDRHENMMRVARLAASHADRGELVICALVSPYEASRQDARNIIGPARCAIVYVDTPLRVCAERDPKGLYARARRGELAHLTGVDDPYEAPQQPDLRIDASACTPEQAASAVIELLEARGWIPRGATEPAARPAGADR